MFTYLLRLAEAAGAVIVAVVYGTVVVSLVLHIRERLMERLRRRREVRALERHFRMEAPEKSCRR